MLYKAMLIPASMDKAMQLVLVDPESYVGRQKFPVRNDIAGHVFGTDSIDQYIEMSTWRDRNTVLAFDEEGSLKGLRATNYRAMLLWNWLDRTPRGPYQRLFGNFLVMGSGEGGCSDIDPLVEERLHEMPTDLGDASIEVRSDQS